MAQWLVLLPHSKKAMGMNWPAYRGFSGRREEEESKFSKSSSFLPQPKDIKFLSVCDTLVICPCSVCAWIGSSNHEQGAWIETN